MPVHFFKHGAPRDVEQALTDLVSDIERRGEEVIGAQPYGMLTAIFTRRNKPAPVKSPARKAAR